MAQADQHTGYGAVLDPTWSQTLTRSAHPVDGSPVFSTTAVGPGGPSRSVLLLHGVGNDGSIFGPIMPSLAEFGAVTAPTLAPELLTDVGDDRAHMSEKLVDWLIEVCPPPWHLVGHSMGGVMAGLIMRTRPDLVAGAVLINSPLPGVVDRIRTHDTVDRAGRALLFMKALATVTQFGRPRLPRVLRGTERAAVRLALRGFVHDPRRLDDQVVSRAILGSRTADGNKFIRLAAQLPSWESDPFDAVPVTIVLGDADPLIPLADVDRIVASYPAATVEVVAQSGHFTLLEWPAVVVDAISACFTASDAR
ncbi:MAG: alpha/beta hydrolase [Ilumatobacteraceae bacterium]